MTKISAVITGTGSYIPNVKVPNSDFASHNFLQPDGTPYPHTNEELSIKFKEITGIAERRYAEPQQDASDLAIEAAKIAVEDAGIDPETLDLIIVGSNFGDVKTGTIQTDFLPSIASRVKHGLKIKNPACVAFDVIFGCPGWLQGLIIADTYIKAGQAKKCLIIGAETLSRVLDPHERDSMIYSDGAGACVLEAKENNGESGILSWSVRTDTLDEAYYLFLGKSNNPDADPKVRYIKMFGRKIYEYAISNVPAAMKDALDKSGVNIADVKKVFIHQANEKMDEAMIKRFYRLYKHPEPENEMPMSIHLLGNSSVGTIPTLFDLVKKGNCEKHELNKGDVILFASVGAGMNINAAVYRV